MTAVIVIAVEMGLLSLHILSGNLILILISHSNDFSASILCEEYDCSPPPAFSVKMGGCLCHS